MSKYVTDEAMRSAMTLQKGYIDQGDSNNAEGIDSLKAGKNLLTGVITGNSPGPDANWGSSLEVSIGATKHPIVANDGKFSINKESYPDDLYLVSPLVRVEEGKTYTFSIYVSEFAAYEIRVVGNNNNLAYQGVGGGAYLTYTFTPEVTESVRIFIGGGHTQWSRPQLELSSARTEFTASTKELQKYIDHGDKANVEGIEALREGKNLLMGVLTGSGLNSDASDDDWKSAPEAVVGDTLILHDLEIKDGVFSIKEAGDNYIVSPFVNVEEGKTYTFSFYYINGGGYEINIIGGQNIYQTQGATGGTITFTFTSVATQMIYIFIKTDDKKLKNPQLELGSQASQFSASTEDLKKYIDQGDKANAEGIKSIEDRMEEVVQTQLITTPPATLNAQVGYYYCMGGSGVVVDTMTIQLPDIADKNKTKNVQFFMTMGSAPEVTFVSAGTERILYQKDFALEAERSYEVNALWNGHAWVITVVEIIVPFFAKLSLNNGEVVELQGSGELTSTMVFRYRSSLVSVEIGELCTSIGGSAFSGCSGLTSVTIGNGVTSIGDWAFQMCSGLTSITIGSSVTSFGNSVFLQCSGITSIVVDSANTIYDSRDNCNAIINTSTNELIRGCNNTVIPNSVTSIGDGAFNYCSVFTSITIPDSVTSIGGYAFNSCTSLTSITIPDSVTSIGQNAFGYCTSLTSITIGSGVTSIGTYAFSNCTGLASITSLATTAPTIQSETFKKVRRNGTLTVPSGNTGYDVWMGTGSYYLGYYNWTKVEQ